MTDKEATEIRKKIEQAQQISDLMEIWGLLTTRPKDPKDDDNNWLSWCIDDCIQYIARLICAGQTIDDRQLDKMLQQMHAIDPGLVRNLASTVGHHIRNKNQIALTANSKKIWDVIMENGPKTAEQLIRNWHSYAWYDDDGKDIDPSTLPMEHQADIVALVKDNNIQVPHSFLVQFAEAIDHETIKSLIPETIEAFTWLANKRKGDVGPSEIKRHLDAIRKGLYEGAKLTDYRIKILAGLANSINPPHNTEVLDYVRNSWKCKNPKAAYHYVAAQCCNIPVDVVEESIIFLAKSTVQRKITLAAPFNIPADITGDTLCKVLVFLAESADIPQGALTGNPTEQELTQRAFETQIADQKLFASALDSRDLLETRQATTTDHVNLLWGTVTEAHKNQGFETNLARMALNHSIEADDLSALMHIAARMGTTETRTGIPYEQTNALWGSPLTEKTARRLYEHLCAMELAQHINHQKGGQAP